MKAFLISSTLGLSLAASLLFFSHAKFEVKYRQTFGGKVIIICETLTLAEKFQLQNKKGFIEYQ